MILSIHFKIEPRKLAKIHNPVDFDEMDCKFSDVEASFLTMNIKYCYNG